MVAYLTMTNPDADAAPSRQPPKSMQLIGSRVVDVVFFLKGSELILVIYSVKVTGKTPSLQ